ncbi:outer membrane beta-barrel protein [Helicobacter mustelae]|uniref:Putative membrane protein n=1 Tax=Helicobacter mustelae (strain ATCC 43772 / CCUG 25715 / CIP 103759 / LMG 18044 / NCTC 12198 / R85-136P) TaxID=679897 RepID=D3UJD4_HELM1|nr:outer membrane beta-barrel protein [Helicobacter mustelae]CBG40609.1 putative membrane protein [Helicobacter mustelae 12198]SQH72107.1 outer membrane protein [Helicobacter mustelae]STP13250.1 outer membrane protein [Helicobacter mustelae]
MKKFFCVFFAILLYVSAEEATDTDEIKKIYEEQNLIRKKGGQYISFGLGTSVLRLKQEIHGKKNTYVPVLFVFKAGSQTFFTKGVGIRGYFEFDTYSENLNYGFKRPPTTSFFGFFSVGIDLLTEFPITPNQKNFLGAFFGIGLGASIFTDNIHYKFFKNSFVSAGFIAEVGVDLTINIKHRISIGVKTTPVQKSWSRSVAEETDFLLFMNYQYKFDTNIFARKSKK